jgi:hypothetical protein
MRITIEYEGTSIEITDDDDSLNSLVRRSIGAIRGLGYNEKAILEELKQYTDLLKINIETEGK